MSRSKSISGSAEWVAEELSHDAHGSGRAHLSATLGTNLASYLDPDPTHLQRDNMWGEPRGLPLSSRPRRPARPLIWMYSPEDTQRKPPPSNLRALVKTTVLAGMFRPVEKVSVAKSTCSSSKRSPSSGVLALTLQGVLEGDLDLFVDFVVDNPLYCGRSVVGLWSADSHPRARKDAELTSPRKHSGRARNARSAGSPARVVT